MISSRYHRSQFVVPIVWIPMICDQNVYLSLGSSNKWCYQHIATDTLLMLTMMANQMWQSEKSSSVNDMQEQCDMFTQIWKYASVKTNLHDWKICSGQYPFMIRIWVILKEETCFFETNDWDKYELKARVSLLLHILCTQTIVGISTANASHFNVD